MVCVEPGEIPGRVRTKGAGPNADGKVGAINRRKIERTKEYMSSYSKSKQRVQASI